MLGIWGNFCIFGGKKMLNLEEKECGLKELFWWGVLCLDVKASIRQFRHGWHIIINIVELKINGLPLVAEVRVGECLSGFITHDG